MQGPAANLISFYQPENQCLEYVLAGGDDYELAFTAPPNARDAVQAASATAGVRVTKIGRIDSVPSLRLLDAQGGMVSNSFASFDHFA